MNERLWAPWRASLFSDAKAPGCIFCRFPAEDPSHDQENLILHRGDACFVILNKVPYTAGHLMVIPLAHVDDPALMAPLAAEMFTLASRSMEALKKVMAPEGFNLGMNLGRAS